MTAGDQAGGRKRRHTPPTIGRRIAVHLLSLLSAIGLAILFLSFRSGEAETLWERLGLVMDHVVRLDFGPSHLKDGPGTALEAVVARLGGFLQIMAWAAGLAFLAGVLLRAVRLGLRVRVFAAAATSLVVLLHSATIITLSILGIWGYFVFDWHLLLKPIESFLPTPIYGGPAVVALGLSILAAYGWERRIWQPPAPGVWGLRLRSRRAASDAVEAGLRATSLNVLTFVERRFGPILLWSLLVDAGFSDRGLWSYFKQSFLLASWSKQIYPLLALLLGTIAIVALLRMALDLLIIGLRFELDSVRPEDDKSPAAN